jgi:hypothetical protein
MRANPGVYGNYLAPEEHFQGTVCSALLLAASLVAFYAILLNLGKM